MRKMFDLDDIYCVENAREALKQETKDRLKIYRRDNIDIVELLDSSRKSIVSCINRFYLNGYYDCEDIDFESENSIMFDKTLRKAVDVYHSVSNRINYYKDILRCPKNIASYRINDYKEELENCEKTFNEIDAILNDMKLNFQLVLEQNTPFDSIIFHKQDDGKVTIQDWLKPYLNNISFDSLSLRDTNIENYDFSSINGININSSKIKDNTLANTILNGVTFNCYKDGKLYPIDPTDINITGANFTGSKGAIVSLENIDKLPDNCNLTDALIVINSKEDITKFNLERFGNNFFIRQKSVIYKKMIDINLSDYLNYTGSIDTKKLKTINDSLKIDCINEEEIRIENNKILSYLISTELSELIDYDLLYNIIKKTIIINGNSNNNENAYDSLSEIIKNKSEYKIADNYSKEKILSSYTTLFELLKIKYKLEDNILKFYTNNGKFTLDLLKIGYDNDNDNIYITDTDNETFKNIFNLLYSFVFQQEEKENNKIDNNDFNIFSILPDSYEFKHYTNSIIEDTIYNILEAKDYGYSETIKKIK